MKAPGFWHKKSLIGYLLSPIGWLYYGLAQLRNRLITPHQAKIPVICIGNAIAGGAGKTPTALLVSTLLQMHGRSTHFISRGYGGNHNSSEAMQVNPTAHRANLVGDEPLLLSQISPCWVGKDRKSSLMQAQKMGAETVILDDGFQNPTLSKDVSILVIDGQYGNGNEYLIPAGPMREPFTKALESADAVIIIGEDKHQLTSKIPSEIPLWSGVLDPTYPANLPAGSEIIAFAGIGRPNKFFSMLENDGYILKEKVSFPDHHPYQPDDLDRLQSFATQYGNIPLITTQKDRVRLPDSFSSEIITIPVELRLEKQSQFSDWLINKVS